ncbi:hypothetical protein BDV95DRAFT_285736 [Massariosphaeria phaeospora]|uniref:Uncharacterized protein n=1 Tax=Massariosphaeria phaeospora TaxID=100035 RepID=A0A7C8MSJ3_9PLEO|nr:hypothetical protein BDV95DRAFT_285736 [Massariosphaeria phaeospora]
MRPSYPSRGIVCPVPIAYSTSLPEQPRNPRRAGGVGNMKTARYVALVGSCSVVGTIYGLQVACMSSCCCVVLIPSAIASPFNYLEAALVPHRPSFQTVSKGAVLRAVSHIELKDSSIGRLHHHELVHGVTRTPHSRHRGNEPSLSVVHAEQEYMR